MAAERIHRFASETHEISGKIIPRVHSILPNELQRNFFLANGENTADV